MSLFGGIELPGKPDLENIRKLDLLPVRSIMEMQRYGFAIDIPHLNEISIQLGIEMAELKREICSYIPDSSLEEFMSKANIGDDDNSPMNVDSNKQLVELLFETLKIGKGKELKRTKGGGQVSTGRRQLEQLKIEHPVIPLVLGYRERAKLKGTYADKLPRMARYHPRGACCPVCELEHTSDSYRIHTQILSTRTGTGRYASKDPNLQNIPVRSKLGQEIRRSFIASEGRVLVGCDYSQIELRALAHLSEAAKMIEVFVNDEDIHDTTAMEAFGITRELVHSDKVRYRNPSKNVNFAIVFGETAQGLYEQLVADSYGKAGIPVPDWLTLEWCEKFLKKWFGIYPEVEGYMEDQHTRAYRYGMVWDLFGRIRLVPEVRSKHNRIVAAGLRQAGNHPVQGTACELMKLGMAEVQQRVEDEVRPMGVWCWPLMTIHDELIVEVDEEYGDVVKGMMEEVFGNVMRGEFRVPVKAEGKVMERWEK